MEIIATIRLASADTVGVRVRTSSDQQTEIGYDVDAEQLYLDRRDAGVDSFSRSFPGVHRGPLRVRDGTVRLRILVDRSTLEVFGNSGRTVLSDLIFPDPRSDGIEVFAHGGSTTIPSMNVWPLRSVWHTASDGGDT
jgi:levanase